jgi:UDP-N-acetylmuramoyl-tripeptide--D-alanyl-D-alanine ligase
MEPCSLQDVMRRAGGRLAQGGPGLEVRRLHTDSRTLQPGDCFVALHGERFDAHDFLPAVPLTGAVAALISRMPSAALPAEFGLVLVPDTLRALQDFSGDYRNRLAVRIVGVTGSSGKTSTKEMIAAVLRRKFRTQATQGNLNNHIGVPLTLLNLGRADEWGVVEMGMNHPGEIAPLAALARPQVSVITNIGRTHIEHFQDVSEIAEEKAEIIAALPADGAAVLNADDAWTSRIRSRTHARIILAGLHRDADWRAEHVVIHPEGIRFELNHQGKKAPVLLPFYSRVMVNNALLAAAVGGEAGLALDEIAEGLASVKLPGHRMELISHNSGWILNDAYNANPDSMKAALATLKEFPEAKRRVAVLGSMGELGAHSDNLHEEVGAAAAESGMDHLIAVGPGASFLKAGAVAAGYPGGQISLAQDAPEALAIYRELALPGDTLLIKGSRFMKLERVAQELTSGGTR